MVPPSNEGVNVGGMTVRPGVEGEIRELIVRNGRITFAQFMWACLYSPVGGFYSTRGHRGDRIGAHFGTSSTSHPVFGALIARQLEQMWHILDEPAVFHVVEVGSGDGSLAQSIVGACQRAFPQFYRALRYVAADYAPGLIFSDNHTFGWVNSPVDGLPPGDRDSRWQIQRVRTEGLRPFSGITGCILSNELIDNFPFHRFAIQGGGQRGLCHTGRRRFGGSPGRAIIAAHRRKAERAGAFSAGGVSRRD